MDIEHWYFLSWFSRRGVGHEQDGETFFRAAEPLAKRASGDPAMALEPPSRRTGAGGARFKNRQRFRCRRNNGLNQQSVRTRGKPAGHHSAADAKLLDQGLVARLVGTTDVIEQLATLGHELQQPAPRVVVLDVSLEMFSQVGDPFGQDRDLHFGRPGVAGLRCIRLDDFSFTLSSNRHRLVTFLYPAASHQPGQVEYALGDDLAAVDFGQSHKLARDRRINRAAKDGSIPSAQQNGLASLKP